ncbi:hypothetical protein C8R44DRAFT_858004 [Mycena epipterygia]|nr:hypothetical protein C8R44DRAFT_858004 [Mycena epipterygia]
MSESTSRNPEVLRLGANGDPGLVAVPGSKDWLANMIFAVKTMAAGADFLPLPYIRAAFSTVALFLETVDKITKNRDNLKDLCASMVEILVIVREQISAHGDAAAVRFMGLCESFVVFLQFLQDELEMLRNSRKGIRGRLKEIIRVTSMADQLERYRLRLNEMRSNFVLLATIDTNLNVTGIQQSIALIRNNESIPGTASGQIRFRHIALGDINLLYETSMQNKIYKIKIFTARISGETSVMTVAKYDNEAEKWERDLALYSDTRHPSFWQLFGVCHSPVKALIFYDELMPLAVYRQFHRPSSDLVWACVEGMLFKQFKVGTLVGFGRGNVALKPFWRQDSGKYHMWQNDFSVVSTICVRKEPIQLCLTMPDDEWSYSVDPDNETLSLWYSGSYIYQPAESTGTVVPIVSTCQYPYLHQTLIQHLGFRKFYETLIAPWSIPATVPENYHLGSIIVGVDQKKYPGHQFRIFGHIPHCSEVQMTEWSLGPVSKFDPANQYDVERHGRWKRFTFPPCSFKTGFKLKDKPMAFIKLDTNQVSVLHQAWLSQANLWIGPNSNNRTDRWGLIDLISCHFAIDPAFEDLFQRDGTPVESHLFVCPLDLRCQAGRYNLALPESDHYYWALDSTGKTRLSQKESDDLGLPRLLFKLTPWATFWQPYHYNAIRDFHQAKGFDPDGLDVTHLLGLPVVQMELETILDRQLYNQLYQVAQQL